MQIKNRLLFWLFVTMFLLSCTTITIREDDAFDNKKTVTAEQLRQLNIDVREMRFTSADQVELQGWLLRHPEASGTVLYFGGNGFLLAIARDILLANYHQKMNVFAFDYRGYGWSEGTPSIDGLKKDARAAYTLVTDSLKIRPQSLVLHGHSMGTFIALDIARQYAVAGVILESPVTNVRDWTDKMVPALLEPFIDFDIDPRLGQEDNLRQIEHLKAALLIVTGSSDKVTPPAMAEDLFDTYKGTNKKIVLIEGGGHNDLPGRIEYEQSLRAFYNRIFGSGMASEIQSRPSQ